MWGMNQNRNKDLPHQVTPGTCDNSLIANYPQVANIDHIHLHTCWLSLVCCTIAVLVVSMLSGVTLKYTKELCHTRNVLLKMRKRKCISVHTSEISDKCGLMEEVETTQNFVLCRYGMYERKLHTRGNIYYISLETRYEIGELKY